MRVGANPLPIRERDSLLYLLLVSALYQFIAARIYVGDADENRGPARTAFSQLGSESTVVIAIPLLVLVYMVAHPRRPWSDHKRVGQRSCNLLKGHEVYKLG